MHCSACCQNITHLKGFLTPFSHFQLSSLLKVQIKMIQTIPGGLLRKTSLLGCFSHFPFSRDNHQQLLTEFWMFNTVISKRLEHITRILNFSLSFRHYLLTFHHGTCAFHSITPLLCPPASSQHSRNHAPSHKLPMQFYIDFDESYIQSLHYHDCEDAIHS